MQREVSVMVDLSGFVKMLYGFKQSGGSGYPCHWCGVPTTLLDAERFHVCDGCQREEIRTSYVAMKAKYPNAGTDERNPEFFRKH